jgi:hypothetical protein
MELITLQQARKQGLKRYFTGKPCKYGHLSERLASTKNCIECNQIRKRDAYRADPAAANAASKARRDANPEREKAKREANKERRAKTRKDWYEANKKSAREYSKAYSLANRDKIYAREKARRESDPAYLIRNRLRARVFQAIKKCGTAKTAFTQDLLGCTYEDARRHIASQFLPGMSWKNHGKWEIDHIRPCASFDLTDPEQQRQCFHYTNLQPLWWQENRSKGDSLDWQPIAA